MGEDWRDVGHVAADGISVDGIFLSAWGSWAEGLFPCCMKA